jgi:hypothetical protein
MPVRNSALETRNLLRQSLYVAISWFCISCLIRLVLACLIHWFSLSNGFDGFLPWQAGRDDVGYFRNATIIANGEIPPFYHAYSVFLAALFRITGPSIIIGKFVNCFFAAASVAVAIMTVYVVLVLRGPENSANLPLRLTTCGVLLSVYPSELFYSTQLVKDCIILLTGNITVLLLALAFNCWHTTTRVFSCILGAGSLTALLIFRPYAAAAILLSVPLYMLLRSHGSKIVRALLLGGGLLAGYAIPSALGYGPFGSKILTAGPGDMEQFRKENYSSQQSSLGIDLDPSSPMFVPDYAYSIVTVMLGPLPWQIKNANVLIALPEAIFFWFTIPFLWQSIRRRAGSQGETFSFPLVSAVSLLVVLAFIGDNLGADTRLRLLVWNMLFIHISSCSRMPEALRKIIFGRRSASGQPPETPPSSAESAFTLAPRYGRH